MSWVLEVRGIINATMPGTFARIAMLSEHRVNVVSLARGGFSLTRHAEDQAVLSTLKDKSRYPKSFFILIFQVPDSFQ